MADSSHQVAEHESEECENTSLTFTPPPSGETAPYDLAGENRANSGESLEDIRQQQEKQALEERKGMHKLRSRHAWFLLALAFLWSTAIWFTVLLQGYGHWFWVNKQALPFSRFHLSDSVLIAFITSTTATVLGLYGIAAYWLFGAQKNKR